MGRAVPFKDQQSNHLHLTWSGIRGTLHIQAYSSSSDVFYPNASTQDLCKRFVIDYRYFIHKLQNLKIYYGLYIRHNTPNAL